MGVWRQCPWSGVRKHNPLKSSENATLTLQIDNIGSKLHWLLNSYKWRVCSGNAKQNCTNCRFQLHILTLQRHKSSSTAHWNMQWQGDSRRKIGAGWWRDRTNNNINSNPIPPVVSLLPSGLPPLTFACTVSSELLGFWLHFSLFFVSGPCARLSWPSRHLLSAR